MKEKLFIPNNAIGKLWVSHTPNLDYFHRHEELECNLVVRGQGSYLVGDQRIDLASNSIAWLYPEQEHMMLNASPDFTLWVLVIRPEYLHQTCTDSRTKPLLQANPSGLHVRHLEETAFQKLLTICKEGATTENKSAYHNTILGYLLHACWDAYLNGSMIPIRQHIHPAIKQVAQQLLEQSAEDSLESLSQQVGLTSATISRLFKKQIGVPFTQYRNRCRLERFLAIYGDGYSFTMLDAAREAGFGSYAQFYRVFSDMMGKTPANYQKQRRMLSNRPD